MVSVSVSFLENFGIEKSIGIGFEKLVGAFWQVGVLSRVQLKYLGMMLMGVKLPLRWEVWPPDTGHRDILDRQSN